LVFTFHDCLLDEARRELRRGTELVATEPQVFDVLVHLIRNRDRVVSRDDLLAAVWHGRTISESTLASRINAARTAIGDSGHQQRCIRTIPRKGFRFVGEVSEGASSTRASLPIPSPDEREPLAPQSTALLPTMSRDRGQDTPDLPSGVKVNTITPATPERRRLTIMVYDMIGQAALSARVDPEDLHEIMIASEGWVSEIIDRFEGFIARYSADGIIVYFGYPKAHEDDAERAVSAGLALIGAAAGHRIAPYSKLLQSRIGIATGSVVVGDTMATGTGAKPTIVGESPHIAARLLVLADPDEIVISADTRCLIGGLFDCRDLGAVQIQDMAESIKAFLVLRESANVNRFEALRSLRTELIGREEELELLLRRWSLAKNGEGRVVLVWGEPGIGKSRLAAALQDAIKADRHSYLPFFCSPNRTQTALHPVISQLERTAGIDPTESDGNKLAKLEGVLASPCQGGANAVPLFAELLSIATGDKYALLSLSPQRRKELVLEQVVARIVALAANQPVLMLLEDAHWIDPTTLELFDMIVECVRDLPVLLVITYRPEFVPPWRGRSHVTALTLNRLGPRDNALMISRVAGRKKLPPPLLKQIVARTDGIPLFIEEMTKSVLESGLPREEGAFTTGDPLPVLAVPATLQASLVARLDRIAHVRVIGQTGAALGREFTYAILKAVLRLQDSELGPLLDQLVASEIVHQRGGVPDALYVFKHVLVQDAIYETLLRAQRTQLQGRIVEVLENEFAATVERNPDILAYHCAEAGLWQKAIEYHLRSARMALDRSAPVEAQSQIEKGAEHLRKLEENSTRQQFDGCLQVVVGSTLVMTKGFASPEVATALSKAVELLDKSVYPVESLHALGGLFNYHLIRSESPKGLELAQPLLHHALDQRTAMVINFLVGTANLHMGNFEISRAHLEKARSLYGEEACRPVAFAGGFHIGSFTLVWLSLAYLFLGSFDKAAETISAAVKDARTRLHPFTLVSALLAQARFLSHTGDLEGAIAATDEGLAIALEQRSPYHVARAGILRAWNIVESGNVEEGIAQMERSLTEQRATGGNFQSSYNLSRLAVSYARAGNTAQAIQLAAQAVEEVERTGERWWEAEAHRTRGEILLGASPTHRKEAEMCFQRALECAHRQGGKLWQLHAAQSLATMWVASHRRAAARELLAPIYKGFTDGFELRGLREAKAQLEALGQ
jgi:DNA-binding winged helix-turn-helix (wHTH) protein/tetratricopeptide (TPR) repeat protein